MRRRRRCCCGAAKSSRWPAGRAPLAGPLVLADAAEREPSGAVLLFEHWVLTAGRYHHQVQFVETAWCLPQ